MRVLGVDPGSLASGWALLGGTARSPVVIESGVVRLPRSLSFACRLARLHADFDLLARALHAESAAVEAPFHGRSARSALQLAQARGVILAALSSVGLEVEEYSPAEVKQSVTGNGRADKAQVAHMVVRLLGAAAEAAGSTDLSDAYAVALCHMGSLGYKTALASGGAGAPATTRGRVR